MYCTMTSDSQMGRRSAGVCVAMFSACIMLLEIGTVGGAKHTLYIETYGHLPLQNAIYCCS
jgi:hypothetical protein